MIDICLLGCGGMMPLPDRWLTSMLIRYNGKMILVDCGEGTQIPMKLAGWGFKSIEAICFTHFHGDHILGLPGLLLTMGNSGREETLTLFGPPMLYEVARGLSVVLPHLPFDLKIIEITNEAPVKIPFDDLVISSMPVDHAMPCLSYSFYFKRAGKFDKEKAKNNNVPMKFWSRIQNGEAIESEGRVYTPQMILGEERKGLKVSYSTDTRPTNSLVDLIKDSDLFICEGMYGEDDMLQKAIDKKHMTFSEAAQLANSGNVKEMWLTHYSPSLKNPEEHLDSAKNIFNNTFLGKNLMTKTLKYID